MTHQIFDKITASSFHQEELFEILEFLYEKYNNSFFIENDPISIPHQFSKKEDVEIAAFISATIAWGQRCAIIKSANRWMELMDFAPYDFIINHRREDLLRFDRFVYRTFNNVDCVFFMQSLQNIYVNEGGLENAFRAESVPLGLERFRNLFLSFPHQSRSEKHLANVSKNSSCKRLNMFLRWMIRQDNFGVDFGIWNIFSPDQLYCPLDVHTGNTGRLLGLLTRTQDDWKATEELTARLRQFDPADPVKYDFSLFGLGIELKTLGKKI